MSDMLNQVDVTIQIAGTTCDYETLTLHQSMHGHHHFEVLVNYKPNKPSLWSTTPETVFEQLGETLDILSSSGPTSPFARPMPTSFPKG